MPKTAAKKSSAATTKKPYHLLTDAEFHAEMQQGREDFARLSKAKQRALLIEWDILNPDGTLRRYPMDHVPLGPRN